MKLKRTGTKNASKKKDKTEAFISRQAPGMCFDFNPNVRFISATLHLSSYTTLSFIRYIK